MKKNALFAATVFLIAIHLAHGAQEADTGQGASSTPGDDSRQLVPMPAATRQIMRKEMLDHLAALNEIVGQIAANNLAAAANIAENRMGKSSMGKHRARGMGPGRFMPPEMRSIGWAMHESASELARAAREGDSNGINIALTKVTASCVACHYSFRTR